MRAVSRSSSVGGRRDQSRRRGAYFDFRGLTDIGEYHVTENPQQLPWCIRDYADPKTELGITHICTVIPTAYVADAVAEKALLAAWWTGDWPDMTVTSTVGAGVAITVDQTISSSVPTTGHLFIAGTKYAYTNRVGSVFTCATHPGVTAAQVIGMFSRNDTQLAGYMSAVAAKASNSRIWILTDEPTFSPSFVAGINDRVALIKGIDPLAVCVFNDYTYSARRYFDNWASETIIDEVWWSGPYPITGTLGNRGSPGTFSTSTITDGLAEMATAAALPRPTSGGITPGPLRFKSYIGVHNYPYWSSGDDANPETEYGPFTGTTVRMPSGPWASGADESGSAVDTTADCQIAQQVNAWKNALIRGVVIYSYTRDTSLGGSPPASWSGEIRNRQADMVPALRAALLVS